MYLQKEHRREERRSSHDRKKYHHGYDREKYRKRHHDERRDRDRDTDQKYKSRNEKKHEEDIKTIVKETKKIETLQSMPVVQNVVSDTPNIPKTVDLPSTSTNNIALPSYYNPSVVNAQKFAEQQKKRKIIWQAKKCEEPTQQWTNLKFSQDNDGTKANKFMRLMGIKEAKEGGNFKQKKFP